MKMTGKSIATLVVLFCFACDSDVKRPPDMASREIIVDRVFSNSPAAGHLQSGDRILKIDGEPIFSRREFLDILARLPSGKETTFTVLRNNRKVKVSLVPNKGRFRFGFRFKIRDPEIAGKLKFYTRPGDIDPGIKRFSIMFQEISLMDKSGRSPQKKVLYRLKDLLVSKGYFFTEDYDNADFVVKAEFKYPETDSYGRKQRRGELPFEAVRVLLLERRSGALLMDVSGPLDSKKVRMYGVKECVYSLLDAMMEDFPPSGSGKITEGYASSEKKILDDKPTPVESRFPGAGPL